MMPFEPTLLAQEEFGQREPLTTRLHGLVRSYPKGVGLIQEFLQNADDAGASVINVFLDHRVHPFQNLPSPSMSELQGPALVSTNDGHFSEEDWANIQQIGASGKARDATKTGKFGLGFNCVYNVTDFPTLLTGHRIGIFDPHGHTVSGASPERPGRAWRLDSALWSHCPDLLAPFEDFGLSRGALEYPQTAFRLPLRTSDQASKSLICQEAFTIDDFDLIVKKLRPQICDLLLFLRSVQDIDIWSIDERGNRRLLLSAHTNNRSAVDGSRKIIRQALETEHESLLAALSNPSSGPFVSEYSHDIDFKDLDGADNRFVYQVVNGLFRDPAGKVTDCARQMLLINEKAVPLAGAAVRTDALPELGSQGRVFCSLPLPVGSPLGICNINGFFDLQADRQGLFQDLGAGGTSAFRVTWNQLLLEHCCSEAAARLCVNLSRVSRSDSTSRYEHWPRIPRQEQSILDALPKHVYGKLRNHECIATGTEATWRFPKDVTVLPPNAPEDLRTALLSDTFPLPDPPLPDFIGDGFAKAGASLATLSANSLRTQLRVLADPNCELPKASRPCLREVPNIGALLKFCTSDGAIDDLYGVPLALMSNGKLRAFGLNQAVQICLAGAAERALLARNIHWFIDTQLEAFGVLRESKRASIMRFTPQRVVSHLPKVLPVVGSEGRIVRETAGANFPAEEWICSAFEYMTSHAAELKLDGSMVQQLPLVPDQFGALHVMGKASTPLLAAAEDSKALLAAVSDVGVPLVTGSDKLLKAIRGFATAFPDIAVWRLSARDLIDTMSVFIPTHSSGGEKTRRSTGAILDYLSAPRVVKDLESAIADRVDALRKIPLFPTSSGQIVSLEADGHYIPEAYEMPAFALEVGLLETGRNQHWLPLYRVLRVPTLTRARLVTRVLLPRIEEFSDGDCQKMLHWLRSNLHIIREEEDAKSGAALVEQLGSLLPIHCTDGQIRPPRHLYHPNSTAVAALLGGGIGFPDLSVYSDRPDLWLEFFETLGMVQTPRASDIVESIDKILSSTHRTEAKASRISDIAAYLNDHWDELRSKPIGVSNPSPSGPITTRLLDALSTREWLPVVSTVPRDYPAQLLTHKTNIFFKPTELLPRTSLHLVGSVRPVCRIFALSKLQHDIGLQAEPTLDDVLRQLENAVALIHKPTDDSLLTVFRRIYAFLGRQFTDLPEDALESDPRVLAIRARFADKTCLVDQDRQFWQPAQSFAEPVPGFLGLRARIRAESPETDRGLRVLGRRDRPDSSDYSAFFKELMVRQAGEPVSDDKLQTLRSAYHAAAELDDGFSFQGCPVLVNSGVLAEAATAILDDAPWLSERARNTAMAFMDSALGVPVAIAFGVRLLSSAVYERPQEQQRCSNPQFIAECAELEERLQSSQLCTGVHRLLESAGASVRLDLLERFLANIRVVPASQLSTILVWSDINEPIDGSIGPCDVVFDHHRNAIIVSDEADEVLYERVGSVLSNELRLDGHDLRAESGHLVAILRVDPDSIERLLTKLHVRSLPAPPIAAKKGSPEEVDGYIDTTEEHPESEMGDSSEPSSFVSPKSGAPTDHAPSQSQGDAGPGSRHEVSERDAQHPEREFPDVHEAPSDHEGQPVPMRVGQSESVSQSPAPSATIADLPERSEIRPPEHKPSPPDPGSPPTRSGPPVLSPGPTAPNHPKLRSEQTPAQRGRARTYVTPHSESKKDEAPEQYQHRQRVDRAAVSRVMQFEIERKRHPKEMPPMNEGYDIESYLSDGRLDRFIEVKGCSGAWGDLGVSVTRSEYRKASKEGGGFWLYVVEFALEPDRARVYAIQNPAQAVDEYWFDGGWRDLATERSVLTADGAPKMGSRILLDGTRQGTIIDIHRRGVLMLLNIEFEDSSRTQVVYSPRRIQILRDPEEASDS